MAYRLFPLRLLQVDHKQGGALQYLTEDLKGFKGDAMGLAVCHFVEILIAHAAHLLIEPVFCFASFPQKT